MQHLQYRLQVNDDKHIAMLCCCMQRSFKNLTWRQGVTINLQPSNNVWMYVQ